MNRTSFYRNVTAVILLGLLLTANARAQPKTSPPPNIVILLADDLGYGELGCQGNPQIPTPHIDSIARDGIRFTAGYVTASYCSPSRAGLMTGRYPTRFGYEFNLIGAENEESGTGLPGSEKTLGRVLHNVGYTTGLIGKWHLGGSARYYPLRRGFDEFFGFLHEGHFFVPPPYNGVTTMLRRKSLAGGGQGRWVSERLVYSTHMGNDEPPYDANNPIYRGGQPVEENAYLTDALTREAVDFIDRHGDKPFFLYLAYNAVHSPLQAADSYMRRFDRIEDIHRRIFAGMLGNLDDSVGEVLKKLHHEGLDENTLVFFLSDNGGPTRELTSSNLPLRDGKGSVYEGGLRVPFMTRWTGTLPAGRVYEKPVISLDIFATAVELAQAPLPKGRKLDGVNLMPYLTGVRTDRPHELLFWRMNQRTAVRVGDWKLLRNPSRGGGREWQLYDLSRDLEESRDLATDEPGELKRLIEIWEGMNAQMIKPLWQRGR